MAVQQQASKIIGAVAEQLIWTVLGSISVLIIGSVLWWIGAAFTVVFFRYVAGVPTNPTTVLMGQVRWTWYLIPFVFSLIEIAGWKVRGQLAPRIRRLATGLTGVDMASTAYGLFVAITGTYFVMLGINNPVAWVVYVTIAVSAAIGWWVTLTPERYILDSLTQLYEAGKFIYITVKG